MIFNTRIPITSSIVKYPSMNDKNHDVVKESQNSYIMNYSLKHRQKIARSYDDIQTNMDPNTITNNNSNNTCWVIRKRRKVCHLLSLL